MAWIDPKKVPKRTLLNGQQIPCIGMGTFGSDRFTAEQISAAVAGAIRCGYRLFDCASVYGNEDQIGQVFAQAFQEGVVKREELFIASKVWNDMHWQGDVLLSLAKTLKDLQLDYLDAYFVHWPFPNYHAPGCDGDSRNPDSRPFKVEDFMTTWRQMERLYDMGLVKNLGMSSMTIPKLEAVLPLCRIKPTLIEMELHPGFQQPELYDYVVAHGIQPIGFCPIGSPTRPDRDTTPDDVADIQMEEVVLHRQGPQRPPRHYLLEVGGAARADSHSLLHPRERVRQQPPVHRGGPPHRRGDGNPAQGRQELPPD